MPAKTCAITLIVGMLAACSPGARPPSSAMTGIPAPDGRCTAGVFVEGRGCTAATRAPPPSGPLEEDDARFATAIASLALEPKCPAETVDDLLGAPPDRNGRWQELASAANAVVEGLDVLERSDETRRWSAVASARGGVMYAQLATSLRGCSSTGPSPIALFGVRERMQLEAMRASGEHYQRPELIEKANELEAVKLAFWTQRRSTELDATEKVAIAKLGRGLALSNAYGVSHPIFDRARRELSTLSGAAGPERMINELARWLDPTDPSRRRKLDAVRAGFLR